MRTDLSAGVGYLGQSDLWGFMGMPFINITDKFQFVSRYTFLDSCRANGVLLAPMRTAWSQAGATCYNEVYLGANYYFYGHKLKLQSGLQFADMNDSANDGGEYSGIAWTTGIRVGW